MRGKTSTMVRELCDTGITPAYAGKNHKRQSTCSPRRDHPRLCGEKSAFPTPCSKTSGSPPPMRGKSIRNNLSLFLRRITPAYAGKNLHSMTRLFGSGDHPRLCGEKMRYHWCNMQISGSPPPMRGKICLEACKL